MVEAVDLVVVGMLVKYLGPHVDRQFDSEVADVTSYGERTD